MHTRFNFQVPFGHVLAVMVSLAALVGCASTAVDAQWRSTELPAGFLRGALVMVNCETSELVLQRICEDRVSADLAALGARPVLAAPGAVIASPAGVSDAQALPAARGSGAKALFSVTIGVASRSVSQGMSIGIGGFGFGSNSGGGIGLSAPIGGGQVSAGYSASARVTEVASGKLVWTARATSPASSDVNAQLAELSKIVVDAAAKAGLF